MELTTWAQTPIPPVRHQEDSAVPPPQDCGETLLDVTDRHPRIQFDATYARQGVAQAMQRCYLRTGLWHRLVRAAECLPDAYTLLVFDGLRPLAVQREIYIRCARALLARAPSLSPKELERRTADFVALPVKCPQHPASHTTGGAVDLTLCYHGAPLDMGTAFDEFTSQAHTDWFEREDTDEKIRINRRMLYHLMHSVGLLNNGTEWWHYAYGERVWAQEVGLTPIYGFCKNCDFPPEDR